MDDALIVTCSMAYTLSHSELIDNHTCYLSLL